MNTIFKRVISLMLCLVLLAGIMPVSAIATETGETTSSEATEPSTEATEPSTEATEPSTEATEPSTEATEPSTEATEPSTEATEPEVVAVTGITLDHTAVEVGVGALPMTLTATVLPEDVTDKTVTWTSSEPGVVSVENGVLTFGYMGEAVITATAGEFSASCTVTVSEGEWSGYSNDDIDYLFIATDRHANSSVIGNVINNMESAIGENELDYLALGGDMVGSGSDHPAYNSSTVLSEVTGATSSLSADNVDIVAGIHDMNVTDDAGIVLPYQDGGAQIYEGDRFYVYGVEEYCISDDSNESNWSSEAQKFVTWANGSDIDKSKVIVVVSHYPLHVKRSDNDGAYYWHQALNTVATGAASGDSTVERNILFFHGHNHTVDSNEYVYNVGDTMSIQNGSSTTSDTIYYTYATAGYLNQNSKATLVTITEDTVNLTKYSTSGSGTAMTSLDRAAEPVTLTSIKVEGQTEYTVGDTFVNPTVTAVYSDGTTKDISAECNFTGYDLSTTGTQTVTVTWGGQTTTYAITVKSAEPTVNTVSCWDNTEQVYIEATGLGLTAVAATNVTGDNSKCDEVFTENGYMAFDIALEGYTEGEVTYSISVVADLDITNLELYYVEEDGTLTPVEFELTTDELNNVYVEFTADHDGTFVYGSPNVPEGYVLTSLTLANIPTDVFLGGSLVLDETAEITATYTMEGAEDFVRKLTIYDYDASNFSGFDVNVAGKQTVTFTFEGVSATHDIYVWGNSVEKDGITVALDISGEEYGVTAVNVAESTNEYVETAVGAVMSSYTAYDISLVYEDGYAATEDVKTVILPIPEDVENPVVYYVSDSGKSVVDMKAEKTEDGKSVTFTTTHFSTYVIGESTEIEVPENETASGSDTTTTTTKKTVYVLTSSISSGNEYLIVNGNSAGSCYALANNSGSVAATGVTVKTDSEIGTYIELDDATDELWTVSNSYRFQNNGYNLRYSSGLSLSTSNNTTWSYSNNRLSCQSGRNTYYLRYNSGWTTTSSSSSATSIYFYVPTEIEVETTTTVSGTWSIEGTDETVAAVPNSTFALNSTLTFTPDSGDATTVENPEGVVYGVYEGGDPLGVISGIDENGTVTLSGKSGKALVKVSYETEFGTVTDYITIEATTPDRFSIQLHEVELTVAEGVTADNFASGTYYIFDSTTGFYQAATAYADGTTYYTLPVILGDEITAPIALKGIEKGDSYAVWAVVKAYATAEDTEGVDVGTLGDALSWSVSDESIATINEDTGVITFTGMNYGSFTVTAAYEGADGQVVTDTITISATESLYTVPGDGTNDFPEYPNEGAVRFDKTATAVGNYSETGIAMVELSMTGVPYSTGSEIDVVVMLDMTGSMSDDGMEAAEEATKAFMRTIVINEDGTYNDNRIAVYAFNSGSSSPYELVALKTIKSDAELEAADTAIATASDKQASGGTPYDEAAKQCYDVLQAAKTDGIGNDRQQFCVYMSDGGPTTYEGSDGYLYYGGNNSSGDRAITSYISGYTSSTASDWSFNLPTEYYTDLMKADGVTVYTVGLLLQNAPSSPAPWSSMTDSTYDSTTDSLTTIGSHYYFTSTLLKNMATSSAHYIDIFSVDTADDATAKFQSIAQKIVEAAKDVVVEDKIGSNYTMNFSIPGYGTENAVSEDALDGLTEFYIQVVEYQLDDNKERTGDPTVLENFTFNADGSFKSHTVNGTACENCTHVTVENGTITGIVGTYFSYENIEGDGEYLHWETDKLTTTELALQYFAYLDNSTGVDAADQIPAATYYTNEYATLTYTNFNGNQVQQEFPVPQMTWNGAQVSYVFYLVNDAGQPVNRAGRVVPFAEAVYVTDVYTYSVIWNDLEQSAGLEAKYLAETLVPDVYALYDDDASYNIHVYEDQEKVNLNNHFVIGGDVTDAYNITEHSWTNPKTTYVFNNKSDATKYNEVGAYIANDGNDNTDSTSYYCKSAAIEGATYETSVDEAGVTVYTVTSVGSGYQKVNGETQVQANVLPSKTGATVIGGYAYYVDENGQVYTIVEKTDGSEVEKGFDFSNTTVAFAVVWKPELVEDAVVVDYGLDVVIDVIKNDNMAAGVVGVRTDVPSGVTTEGTYTRDEDSTLTSVDVYIDSNNDGESLKENKIGTATVENMNQVRFSLDQDNGMQFTDPAEFYYEADVNYYDSSNTLQSTSMYSSVTVIPATTVYYEDAFIALTTETKTNGAWTADETSGWTSEGTQMNATQAQDRPGASKISAALDADNNYGYDEAYSTMSQYSLGSSAKVNVYNGHRAKATFEFYGTGFDVISLTSNQTGTIMVSAYAWDENSGTYSSDVYKSYTVDTYYGMEEDGTISLNAPTALYQVPVMKMSGMTYGKYKVEIVAAYASLFDHEQYNNDSYDFYLDAIRIYDPTGNLNETANNAYVEDGEGWPVYEELRDNIISGAHYTVTENEDGTISVTVAEGEDNIGGAIFIDCNDENTSIKDYVSYGPNNELYLANGQAIAFNVTVPENVADIQLGIKVGNGNSVAYEINGDSYTVNTATDMYYSILDYAKAGTVVIKNVSSGILSLTNIKVTHTSDPYAISTTNFLWMDSDSAGFALMSLRPAAEEEVPEATVPEESVPETTVPGETDSEETEPDVTAPEATEPEATEPSETPTTEEVVQAITNAVKDVVNKVVNALSNLFGRWFR